MLFLFKKPTEEEKSMFDALMKIKTLKVTEGGAIIVSPNEIINNEDFIKSKKKVIEAIQSK